MLKKIFASLFPGLFVFAGLFFIIKAGIPSVKRYFEEKHHVDVTAKFIEGRIDSLINNKGRDEYILTASYRYHLNGQEYIIERVNEVKGRPENIQYEKRILENTLYSWKSIDTELIRIDPNEPYKFQYSDRVSGTDLILIFFIPTLFILIGGIIIWIIFRSKPTSIPEKVPWTVKKDWRTNVISCNTKTKKNGMLVFSILWNSFCFVICYFLFFSGEEVESKAVYIVLIFPLIGFFLFLSFVRRYFDYKRYGEVKLEMDPFPASIGGHFGGHLYFQRSLPANSTVSIQLNCIKITYSGSGDNRSKKETLIWQNTGFAYLQNKEVSFKLEIPSGLEETSLHTEGIHWRADITVSYNNHHFDRQFQIPVYETGQLSSVELNSEQHPAAAEHASELINEVTEFAKEGENYVINYPNFRVFRNSLILGFLIGGAILTGCVFSIINDALPTMMICIFAFIGSVFFGLSTFELFYTLSVELSPDELNSVHKWLGIPIKKLRFSKQEIHQFKLGDYVRFNASGGKHSAYYKVVLESMPGKTNAVAIRLRNKATAEQMKDFFDKYYQLEPTIAESNTYTTQG